MTDRGHYDLGESVDQGRVVCWSCAAVANLAMGVTGAAYPRTGDVAVCFKCAAIGIYQSGPFGLLTRSPTEAEEALIMAAHGDAIAALRQTINEWQAL